MARVTFANVGMVKVPDSVTDEQALMKNLTIRSGNCNHCKYIPMLMQIVSAIDAYRMFADKKAGWMKVELRP